MFSNMSLNDVIFKVILCLSENGPKYYKIVLYIFNSFRYNGEGGAIMKYSIEIGKIVEGALKHDMTKVLNYTRQLVTKLENDEDARSAAKFQRLLSAQAETALMPMGSSSSYSIPVDVESRMNLADIIYPDQNDIKVVLSKRNAEKLESFILSCQNAEKLNSVGIDVPNSLLLYGPPGCGKTKCAYLIAKQLSLPLVIARLDSMISSYLGTTAKNIRSLFEFSQKMPCVLFLDEFDAIAKARDDNNELGELKRVVNSLLQNIDTDEPRNPDATYPVSSAAKVRLPLSDWPRDRQHISPDKHTAGKTTASSPSFRIDSFHLTLM